MCLQRFRYETAQPQTVISPIRTWRPTDNPSLNSPCMATLDYYSCCAPILCDFVQSKCSWHTIYKLRSVASRSSPKIQPVFSSTNLNIYTTKMMFSKLSIFVAVTLAAFATAAGPLPQAQDGSSNVGNVKTNNVNGNNVNGDNVKTLSCPSSPVKCCKNKHQATSDDVKLAHDKLGVDISPSTEVWVGCFDFAQGNTCAGPTVCCDKSASDGSIAIRCTDAKA